MEDLGTLFLTVVVVVVFTAFLSLRQRRKTAAAWQATVTRIEKKRIERNRLEDEPALYDEQIWIRYRTDAGKKGKVQLPSQVFEERYAGLKEGDRLNKSPGEDFPERI